MNRNNLITVRGLSIGAFLILFGAALMALPSRPGKNSPISKVVATEQGLSQKDLDLTARIRNEIYSNDGLSTAAKNITIVSQNGHVTLNGEVENLKEKRKIDAIVSTIAGKKRFSNNLVINSETLSD